jgi:hypothetical protein
MCGNSRPRAGFSSHEDVEDIPSSFSSSQHYLRQMQAHVDKEFRVGGFGV